MHNGFTYSFGADLCWLLAMTVVVLFYGCAYVLTEAQRCTRILARRRLPGWAVILLLGSYALYPVTMAVRILFQSHVVFLGVLADFASIGMAHLLGLLPFLAFFTGARLYLATHAAVTERQRRTTPHTHAPV